MTECGALTAPSMASRVATKNIGNSGLGATSAGEFLPGVSAKVVKDDGSVAATGEIGELWVRTPSLAAHYLGEKDR